MRRALSIAVAMLILTFAAQAAPTPVAHVGDQCELAAFEDFQEDDASIRVDFSAIGGSTEASHGGFAPHCGDPCDVEGTSRGCVYYRNGVLAKTTCTCMDGYWTCF